MSVYITRAKISNMSLDQQLLVCRVGTMANALTKLFDTMIDEYYISHVKTKLSFFSKTHEHKKDFITVTCLKNEFGPVYIVKSPCQIELRLINCLCKVIAFISLANV